MANADDAHEMLYHKRRNAYAAAVGAYLLLRLRMFERLHDWPKNLANMYEFLPDGCVIWASLLINRHPSEKHEIQRYLFMAVDRGLPVYAEGLRLLLDGLRLLGTDAETALEKVTNQAGVLLPNSPVSASVFGTPNSEQRFSYRIGFGLK